MYLVLFRYRSRAYSKQFPYNKGADGLDEWLAEIGSSHHPLRDAMGGNGLREPTCDEIMRYLKDPNSLPESSLLVIEGRFVKLNEKVITRQYVAP